MKKDLMMRLVLLLSITLNSCASVKIYDDVWCVDRGKYGAKCFHQLSDGEFSLDKYEWDQLRVAQICTRTKKRGIAYAHMKNAIEKLCADTNRCTLEQKKFIQDINKKLYRAYK